VVCISGYFGGVVAEGYEEFGDFGGRVVGGGEVEGCVGFVGEVGVLQEGGVGVEDAGYEGCVGEVDCAAETGGEVDHLDWFLAPALFLSHMLKIVGREMVELEACSR